MSDVAARDLRNDTRGVLRRVEAGEDVRITVAGRPVAVLRPLPRSTWMSSAELVRRLETTRADPGLTAELAELAPGTTDDLPL